MEPSRQGASRTLLNAADLKPRLEFARSLGNHLVDPHLAREALRRTARRYFSERGLEQEKVLQLFPAAPPPAWQGMPTVGNVRTFALLIDFSDEPHANDASLIHERLSRGPAAS